MSEAYKTVIEALLYTVALFCRPLLIISGVLPIPMNFDQRQVTECEFNAFLLQGKSSFPFANIYF
jgi:hypothetical protein